MFRNFEINLENTISLNSSLEGKGIQNVWEGRRTLYGEIWHFMWGLDNPWEIMHYLTFMILKCRLKTVWKVSQPYCFTLKMYWLGSFTWKAIVCTTKVRDETFQAWEDFFLLGGTNFFGANLRGLFYMGTNDHIMQEGRKRFADVFFSNLNNVNLRIFPDHGGRHTCTSNHMVSSAINNKFDEWQLRGVIIFLVLWIRNI